MLVSCSYPFALESIDDNKVLIVNGIITGDLGNQQIELSLAASLDTLFIIPSSDAEVIVTKNFTETYVFIKIREVGSFQPGSCSNEYCVVKSGMM